MNERLRWWVLPLAIVVLLRVVTLGEAAPEAVPPALAIEASESGRTIALLEASGQRTGLVALPAAAGAFVVSVPTAHRGERGHMTLWRRQDGVREAQPWLTLEPRVAADATIRIAGLAGGRYDVEWRAAGVALVALDAAAPGQADVVPLAPLPPR